LPAIAGVGSLAKPAGVVLAFAWLVALLSRRAAPFLPRDRPVLAFLAGALLVWVAASALWAENSGEALTSFTRLLQVVILFLIIYSAIRSSRDIRVLGWAFLIGAFATAVYSLATSSYNFGGRLAGLFDSNFFAAQLVAAMIIAGFMIAATRGASSRLLLIVMIITFAVAFVLTQSRGGLVALGVALLVSVVYAGRHRRHAIVIALAVAALGVSYYGFVATLDVRERITDFSAEGSAGRADEWSVALQMFEDHPVLGVGIGNYPVIEPRYASRDIDLLRPQYIIDNRLEAHNTYLQIVSEVGVVGFALFISIVFTSLFAAFRAVRVFEFLGNTADEAVARGFVVATVGLLVAYTFLSALYEKQLWLLLGILLATNFVAHRREGPLPSEISGGMRLIPVRFYDDYVPSTLGGRT
jgi:O-antigen ligase